MLSLLLALAPATSSALSFNISNVFSSHAVLQRNKTLTLWGWGDPSQQLRATWVDGISYTSTFTDDLWRIAFPPTPANFTPFSLAITSSTGDAVTLTDLLLGDVIGCFGQCVPTCAPPRSPAPPA